MQHLICNAANLPKFIALCAVPKSGKSLVQEILADNYGVRPIDSGLPLRQIAMQHYGLTHNQVFTQEGKLEDVEILGKTWQVRKLLGEIGNRFEEMHGDCATPWMATRSIPREDVGPFCDGACRKTQGRFYKALGGVVVGIRNPLAVPTGNKFDLFDESLVDLWIENDALVTMTPQKARKDLELKVDRLVEQIGDLLDVRGLRVH